MLFLAAWFGLATGILEGPLWMLKRTFIQPITFSGQEVLWLAPASYVPYFLVLGGLLWFSGRMIPRLGTAGVTLFGLALLGSWSLLLIFKTQLHAAAILVVALGAAAQMSRALAARMDGFTRLARRSLPLLAAVPLLLLAGFSGGRLAREWRAIASLPAPAGSPPNVILVVWDAVRALNLSTYGYPRATSPTLDSLAGAGVTFGRAVATAPWTLPSHAGMFTGRWAHELGSDWGVPLDGRFPTLAGQLASTGYLTLAVVGNNFYASRETGLGQGFLRYDDWASFSIQRLARSSTPGRVLYGLVARLLGMEVRLERRDADEVNSRALAFLDRHDRRQPFFLFVNYYDAHDPYQPPPGFAQRFLATETGVSGGYAAPPETTENRIRRLIDGYDAAIAATDDGMRRLLDGLRQRGLLENTLLIVTSDHGDEFGEHGVFEHGKSLYWPVIHVPLVVVAPGRAPAGAVVSEPVSLRDLPATVFELIGRESGPFPGSSLSRWWRPGARGEAVLAAVNRGFDLPPGAPASRGDMRALVLGRLHFIRNGDGKEELYDVVADPFESRDLLATADSATLQALRSTLDSVLASGGARATRP